MTSIPVHFRCASENTRLSALLGFLMNIVLLLTVISIKHDVRSEVCKSLLVYGYPSSFERQCLRWPISGIEHVGTI
jgi:hypothetical protein